MKQNIPLLYIFSQLKKKKKIPDILCQKYQILYNIFKVSNKYTFKMLL